ncbi:MAG TPA: VCBS repeat-containing protein [Pyrinomonadaceae bacterium]
MKYLSKRTTAIFLCVAALAIVSLWHFSERASKAAPGCATPSFAVVVSPNINNSLNALALGDLNGDTKPDLVVANYYSDQVSILTGNGAGNFTLSSTTTTGQRPSAVLLGDCTTPAQFVDALFLNAGVSPTDSERASLINEFGTANNTADTAARARVIRRVAENPTLAQLEYNRAFVLMQYFGYLRRNPNDPPEPGLNFDGYNFWLTKLNQFNGNFVNADMVKAFIVSSEYRGRFGP